MMEMAATRKVYNLMRHLEDESDVKIPAKTCFCVSIDILSDTQVFCSHPHLAETLTKFLFEIPPSVSRPPKTIYISATGRVYLLYAEEKCDLSYSSLISHLCSVLYPFLMGYDISPLQLNVNIIKIKTPTTAFYYFLWVMCTNIDAVLQNECGVSEHDISFKTADENILSSERWFELEEEHRYGAFYKYHRGGCQRHIHILDARMADSMCTFLYA